MLSVLLRRLTGAVITIILVSLLAFIILEVIPGDPALVIAGLEASPATVEHIRDTLGLHRPAWMRFSDWLVQAVQGNLGDSLKYHAPVSQLLLGHAWVNVILAMASLPMAAGFAIAVGTLAAKHQDGWLDHAITTLSQLSLSIPSFWIGILLILVFAVHLHWLPALGVGSQASWRAFVLPIAALSIPVAGVLSRMVRSSIVEVIDEDYLQTARAKGLSQSRILWRHALKNALAPVLTVAGMIAADMVTGSVIVEVVFGLPGLGKILLGAIQYRDIPLVMGGVTFISIMIVAIHFVTDLLYLWIDPRTRLA